MSQLYAYQPEAGGKIGITYPLHDGSEASQGFSCRSKEERSELGKRDRRPFGNDFPLSPEVEISGSGKDDIMRISLLSGKGLEIKPALMRTCMFTNFGLIWITRMVSPLPGRMTRRRNSGSGSLWQLIKDKGSRREWRVMTYPEREAAVLPRGGDRGPGGGRPGGGVKPSSSGGTKSFTHWLKNRAQRSEWPG